MLQCVAVCCSVLQCAAVCCSVLQCVAVCCSVLQCVATCCSAVCCSVLQYVAVCCSALQRSVALNFSQVSLMGLFSYTRLVCRSLNVYICMSFLTRSSDVQCGKDRLGRSLLMVLARVSDSLL